MPRKSRFAPFIERVASQTVNGENGCLLFEGLKDKQGYGKICKDGKNMTVHRAVWEHYHPEEILSGKIAHKCSNKNCVNRDHLIKLTTIMDRILRHVVINEKGCLLFMGHRNHDGYGRIGKGVSLVFVHREMFKHHNPDIEMTGVIMHTCDTPNCVNIEHLRHGTQAENIADMVAKGRRVTVKGSAQKDAKLTESDIPIIRQRINDGTTYARIARDYAVSESAIRNIKMGRRWTHVK